MTCIFLFNICHDILLYKDIDVLQSSLGGRGERYPESRSPGIKKRLRYSNVISE